MRTPLLSAASAAALLVAGCASQAHLFPVSGPMTSTSASSLSASLSNTPAGHGKFAVTMPDGEVCEGTYKTESDPNWQMGKGRPTVATGSTAIADEDWKAVFDPPPTLVRVQHGQANATGSKGTILNLEFAVDGGSGKGYGVAKDNKGNLYRFEIAGLSGSTGPSQSAVPDAKPQKIGGPNSKSSS